MLRFSCLIQISEFVVLCGPALVTSNNLFILSFFPSWSNQSVDFHLIHSVFIQRSIHYHNSNASNQLLKSIFGFNFLFFVFYWFPVNYWIKKLKRISFHYGSCCSFIEIVGWKYRVEYYKIVAEKLKEQSENLNRQNADWISSWFGFAMFLPYMPCSRFAGSR